VEAFSGLGDKRLRYEDRNQNRENFTTTTLFPKSLPPSYLATNSGALLLGTIIIINQPGKFRGACSVLNEEISWTRLKREHGNGVIGKESIECNFFVSRVLAVDEVSLERERWVFRSVQSRLQY